MSYYIPKYFTIEELFSPETIKENTQNGIINQNIWRLFDYSTLLTIDRLRIRFGPTVVNDYIWGGANQYRGFRSFISLVDKNNLENYKQVKCVDWTSFTSQHCFGRAIDSKFNKISAEEVREDIKNNPNDATYEFITAVENNVSWLHFDTRSWNKEVNGIMFF